MEEPSVLDYVKARLMPWRGPAPEIPPLERVEEPIQEPLATPPQDESGLARAQLAVEAGAARTLEGAGPAGPLQPVPVPSSRPSSQALARPAAYAITIPWRSLLALVLALIAQSSLEPRPDRFWQTGVILYLLSAAWMVVAVLRGEWVDPRRDVLAEEVEHPAGVLLRHPYALLVSLLLALVAFISFGGNHFSTFNITLLVAALAFFMWAFWVPQPAAGSFSSRAKVFFARPSWKLGVSPWTLALLAATALVIFFRFYRLAGVPPEMVSDHAEKLLDVSDVLNGQTRIFFPRNTGREAIQMYLTAGIARYLGTGLSFISLKIGTVLAGLLTLPFIYLLGKEVANRRVGLLALVFAGIAYWPNVIARVGLRFPLYPLFVAPVLYFLVRGLRRSRLNDFLLAGLFLGIGLHGYTPIRILPLVVVAAVGLYLLHRRAPGERRTALVGLVLLGLVALIAFLPLLRYMLENPAMFEYRAFTRLGSLERPLPGPAGLIFLKNLWNAMTMFAWSDGLIWVHSVPLRPALDVVSGALFHLGFALVLLRYLRRRDWLDLFLLLSIPMLMLPSILSLAFPEENPALNRAAGALVPVFLLVGLSLEGLLSGLKNSLGPRLGTLAEWSLALVLVLVSMNQNYDLVFNQYEKSYAAASWNSSEMGQVIGDYARSFGSLDSAWVVPYPYWVDTRLVGVNAGNPLRDYALWPDQLATSQSVPGPKLFLLNEQDQPNLDALHRLYPQGVTRLYNSSIPNHNFWIYFVPASQ